HYGHMVADFAMRVAASADGRPDLPLLFSFWPKPGEEPPEFFWEIVDHLGGARARVKLVREPTRVGRLWVTPQAERLGGKGPSETHLDLMDRIVARHGSPVHDIDVLFVSRALLGDGRLAGEAYLDAIFREAGGVVIHPETLPLARQLDFYRRAKRLVFSEGSAIHSLQVLGRLDADVTVLVRRPGARIAGPALRPRLRSLSYVDITAGSLHGLDGRGRPQLDRALRLVDENRAAALLEQLGLDGQGLWRPDRYRDERLADIRRWIAYNARLDLHPRALETIRRGLARHGIAVDAAAAWAAATIPNA
ncbi:MAG: glycosyltransferase family 61 protein, partial [Methylobacteriaceae bacterium]|nr:glycosyltransferase family 61 protein [Methylobacteriaceae bacterium]